MTRSYPGSSNAAARERGLVSAKAYDGTLVSFEARPDRVYLVGPSFRSNAGRNRTVRLYVVREYDPADTTTLETGFRIAKYGVPSKIVADGLTIGVARKTAARTR